MELIKISFLMLNGQKLTARNAAFDIADPVVRAQALTIVSGNVGS